MEAVKFDGASVGAEALYKTLTAGTIRASKPTGVEPMSSVPVGEYERGLASNIAAMPPSESAMWTAINRLCSAAAESDLTPTEVDFLTAQLRRRARGTTGRFGQQPPAAGRVLRLVRD